MDIRSWLTAHALFTAHRSYDSNPPLKDNKDEAELLRYGNIEFFYITFVEREDG
jgi:hypothetical protein